MRRIATGRVRPGWRERNAAWGLTYNDTDLPDGGTVSYWREGPFYDFTLPEIEYLEQCAAKLHRMCVAAGDHIVATCPRRHRQVRHRHYLDKVCTADVCLMARIGVPEYVHEQVIRTWFDGDADTWTHDDKDLAGVWGQRQTPDFSPSVYGRFDLWWAGGGTVPKLLEFNAQTPTSLVEGAVIQWRWMEDTDQTRHTERQWNSIHERLVEAWRRNLAALRAARPWLPEKLRVFFAYETSETSGEDRMNTAYLAETCAQAGHDVELIAMSQLGWDTALDRVVFRRDPGDRSDPGEPVDVIFMLYPWEWLWHEEAGKPFFRSMADPTKRGTVFIEPPYTAALWSNKGLLPVLWQLYGDDPEHRDLLLPAYFADDKPAGMMSYARKPIWSREGANTTLVRDGVEIAAQGGDYGAEGHVYQQLCELPAFEALDGDAHPVIGVWLVDGEPAGLGIREGIGPAGLITSNVSHFVPHTIDSHLAGGTPPLTASRHRRGLA